MHFPYEKGSKNEEMKAEIVSGPSSKHNRIMQQKEAHRLEEALFWGGLLERVV